MYIYIYIGSDLHKLIIDFHLFKGKRLSRDQLELKTTGLSCFDSFFFLTGVSLMN